MAVPPVPSILLGKPLTMIKRLIIAVVLIVIVCGGLIGYNLFKAQAINEFFAQRKPAPVVVSDTVVKAATWTPGINAVGTAYAASGVNVPAEVAGVVKKIEFKANQHVSEGDVLVVQDDAIEQAELASAQAALKRDQLALARVQALATRGVSSQEALENAQASLEASQAALNKVKATIKQKRIAAPFTGVIGIPQIDVGQYITPGTSIGTLQDLDKIKVDFTVTERDFPSLKMGQAVKIGADADHLNHEGQITGIDPKIDPQSRLVSVEARVDNADRAFQPGQFVRVRVQLPPENDIIAVPQTAVVTSLYGDYVYRVEEEKAKEGDTAANKKGSEPTLVARQVFVTLGRRDGATVEIKKGLKPGDRIVTAGENKVQNGSILKINDTIQPSKIKIDPAKLEGGS